METHTEENDIPRENPAIKGFRETCGLLIDFGREVFLEEIEHFIWSASKEELAKLRERIAARTKNLKAHRGKPGRPSSHSDEKQRGRNYRVACRFHSMGWEWPRIAQAEGLKPTKPNIRTVKRWRDDYAAVVWDALVDALGNYHDITPERITEALKNPTRRNWLQNRAGLPFREYPQECEAIVVVLAPIGREASGEAFARRFHYLVQKKTKKAPELGVKKPS